MVDKDQLLSHCKVRASGSGSSSSFTLAELEQVVVALKREKTPGSDGIANEFYQVFLPELKGTLLEVCKAVWSSNKVPKAWSESLLILLPKEGDLRDIQNWRSIL